MVRWPGSGRARPRHTVAGGSRHCTLRWLWARTACTRPSRERLPHAPTQPSAAHRGLLLLLERHQPSGRVFPCPARPADPTWPTNDNLTCIYVTWPRQEFPQVRTDVEGSFRAALKLVPRLPEAVESGCRDQRFAGPATCPTCTGNRQDRDGHSPATPATTKTPGSGMGMSDLFPAADLLAGAIDDGLTGRQPMDAALAGYQHRRDRLTANGFEFTLATARLAETTARDQALYQAAANNPTWPPRLRRPRRVHPRRGVYPGRISGPRWRDSKLPRLARLTSVTRPGPAPDLDDPAGPAPGSTARSLRAPIGGMAHGLIAAEAAHQLRIVA